MRLKYGIAIAGMHGNDDHLNGCRVLAAGVLIRRSLLAGAWMLRLQTRIGK